MPTIRCASLPWQKPCDSSAFQPAPAAWTDLKGPEGGDVFSLLYCPFQAGRLWAGTLSGDVFVKNDESQPWSRCSPPCNPRSYIHQLKPVGGDHPRILASCAGGGLYATDPSQIKWIDVSGGLQGRAVTCLEPHPVYPGFAMLACSDKLFYTPDCGLTWIPYPLEFEFRTITAIAFLKEDPLTFFIADSSQITPRILMTTDGGRTIRVILDGTGKFIRIHTLIAPSGNMPLIAAGYGGAWGVAAGYAGNGFVPEPLNTGLPARRITAAVRSNSGTLTAGGDGDGLFRLGPGQKTWTRDDSDATRGYVKCLSVFQNAMAAGFAEAGVAVRKGNGWIAQNSGLSARSVDVVISTRNRIAAVMDYQAHSRKTGGAWEQVVAVSRVRDADADGDRLYLASYHDGIFRQQDTQAEWQNMELPLTQAVRVKTSARASSVMAVAVPPGGPIQVFRKLEHKNNWTALGSGIFGPLEVFQIASAFDDSWSAISTVGGVFWFDTQEERWRSASVEQTWEIRALAPSSNVASRVYAGAGSYLIVSNNGAQHFEPGYLFRFPSSITSIATTGSIWETIYVSTTNGGLYASYTPNLWQTLLPDEIGVGFSAIRTHNIPSRLLLATKGISCWQVETSSVTLTTQIESGSSERLKILLAFRNPGKQVDVVLHLVQIKPDGSAIFYAITGGNCVPSPTPQPYRFILEAGVDLPAAYIGSIDAGHDAVLMAGIFDDSSARPLGPISAVAVNTQLH